VVAVVIACAVPLCPSTVTFTFGVAELVPAVIETLGLILTHFGVAVAPLPTKAYVLAVPPAVGA